MANITYPYESLTWASYIIGAVALVICVISIMAVWKIYKKAGEHGWACIIPFYSNYVYYRITLKKGWLFFVPLMSSIGAIAATVSMLIAIRFEENAAFLFFMFATLICCITTFVFHIITTYKFSYNFGHGIGFFFGLLFLPIIFYMILGFGQSQYTPRRAIQEPQHRNNQTRTSNFKSTAKTTGISIQQGRSFDGRSFPFISPKHSSFNKEIPK